MIVFSKMLSRSLVIIYFFGHLLNAQSPPIFFEQTYRIENNHSSDISLGVCDINGDFRDDLIRIGKDSFYFDVQVNDGTRFKNIFKEKKPYDIFTTNVGDFNRNNRNEVLFSGRKMGFVTYEQGQDFAPFSMSQELDGSYLAQGSSLVDFDSDGWLDAFLTNDIGYNQLLRNDGSGQLLPSNAIDFQFLTSSQSAGNYNAIWLDVDNDNDLDLFITKCYAAATSFDDPRRVNQLFINENGVFIESGSEYKVNHGDQTWCSDSGDLDNDGDVDIVVINHGTPSFILENIDGEYFSTHETFSSNGIIIGDDVQVTIVDFNEDGKSDILIAGFKTQLLINHGNFVFEPYYNSFGFANMTSFAVGDFNADRRQDVLGVYGSATSGINDRMFINASTFHNNVIFSLHGINSNINGIGARIILYSGSIAQSKWVNAGVGYGISNSLNVHFGLGTETEIDSLICYWPSGTVDRYSQLPVNEHYVIVEGSKINPILPVDHSALELDCFNEEIVLSSNGSENVIWNNEFSSNEIVVNTTGYYHVTSNTEGYNSGPLIYISELAPLEVPEILQNGEFELCIGEKMLLASANNTDNQWSNGVTSNTILIEETGEYYILNTNICDTIISNVVNVNFVDPNLENRSDTLLERGGKLLEVDGDNIRWYDHEFNYLNDGQSYFAENIISDSIYYFTNTKEIMSSEFNGGIILEDVESDYFDNDVSGGLVFEVYHDIILKSVKVETDLAGVRKVLIIKNMLDTVYGKSFDVATGRTILEWDVILGPGEYHITTDESINELSLGAASPHFKSLKGLENLFPLRLYGYLNILRGVGNQNDYEYFFDWTIAPVYEECTSDFIPYSLVLDTTVSTTNTYVNQVSIFPNSTNDFLSFESENDIMAIEIYDMIGQLVYVENNINQNRGQLDVTHLLAGTYVLLIRFRNDKYPSLIFIH